MSSNISKGLNNSMTIKEMGKVLDGAIFLLWNEGSFGVILSC